MALKSAFVDTIYKDEISSTLLALKNINKLKYDDVLKNMEDIMIGSFKKNDNIETWKAIWIKRIDSTATLLNIQLRGNKNSKIIWSPILAKVTDISQLESSSSQYTTTSTTSSTNSAISKASSIKKLSVVEKNSIKKMFDSLDANKMWILSTGTIVEMKMKEFAMDCNYEHPCHSLIFDPDDISWQDYFTEPELDEIRRYNRFEIDPLPPHLESYGSSFKKIITMPDIHKHCFDDYFHPSNQQDLSWMQLSIMKLSRLFIDKTTINFNGLTERDITFYYDFLTSIFEYTDIKASFGESSSNSITISKNKKRKLAGKDKMQRSYVGSMVDMKFKSIDGNELGCGEVGINNNDNSTKELNDGKTKLPKTLKGMLLRLAAFSPSNINKLKTVGYSIMGTKLNMLYMDIPAGYICRINRTLSLYFPTKSLQFTRMTIPLLTLAWNGKKIMDESLQLISEDVEEIPLNFTSNDNNVDNNNIHIPDCFWPLPSSSVNDSSSSTTSNS